MLLPIDEIYLPKEGKRSESTDMLRTFDNEPGSLAAKLRDLVMSEVEAHSTKIA